jgi:DNA mismatch repair protein MutL
MEACIRILDETTANKIAAGEVIERPASVVKELVENSIDAGSTRIEVEIENGGLHSIRVTDNGCGMSRENARLSLARHATSKIRDADDLNHITTLGFRGEAIPSIASVSRFSIVTRGSTDLEGTQIDVEGGTLKDITATGCPTGTTMLVRDLFFNTPARLKYLKTTATEIGHIVDILGRLTLSYPRIAFRLQHNGRQLLATTGSGDGRETMASIYGGEVAKHLLPLNSSREAYSIHGFIAKPAIYRKNRNHQNVFVNGRFVRSNIISRALEDAYQTLLPSGARPIASIEVQIPTDEVDVNVHPTKSEVRFAREKDIFLLVYQSVKTTLQSANLIPNLQLKPEEIETNVPEYMSQPLKLLQSNGKIDRPIYTDPSTTSDFGVPGSSAAPAFSVREPVFEIPTPSCTEARQEPSDIPRAQSNTFPLMQPIGQIDNTYIVAQGVEGMYLIDQHAAHERIIFDRLVSKRQVAAQTMLVPWLWELTPQEALVIIKHLPILADGGFEVEEFGQNIFRVCSIPLGVPAPLIGEILNEFLQDLMQDLRANTYSTKQNVLLMTAACKAAVKANAKLSMNEMISLLNQLKDTDHPYTCPHGRPTVIHFSAQELAKRFKRIQ